MLQDKHFDMTSVGKKHILTIRSCELPDQDDYTIVVEEGVECTAKLTVIGKFSILSQY